MRATLLPALLAIFVSVTVTPVLQAQTTSNSMPPAAVKQTDEYGCDVPLPELLATVNGIEDAFAMAQPSASF